MLKAAVTSKGGPRAVSWAQKFARMNREVMMQNLIAAVLTVITKPFETHVEAVNCPHNYVQKEHHFGKDVLVTRKGAVSARPGELGIIPGSIAGFFPIDVSFHSQENFSVCHVKALANAEGRLL